MVELDQLARQVHGKLDTRFAKLEAVIRDADERIDQLARLLRESSGKGTLDVTIDDEPFEAPRPESASAAGLVTPEKPLTPRGERNRQVIFDLADDGVEPVEIAQRVGRTTGEVELILSLRKAAAGAALTGRTS
jgi:hypothetical protein